MIKQYVVNGQLTVVRFTHDHHITGNHITPPDRVERRNFNIHSVGEIKHKRKFLRLAPWERAS